MTSPWLMYGTAWKKEATTKLVETAVLQGFRAIDTANQPKHYDEPRVGEALKNLSQKGIGRTDLFIQTKFTPRDGQDDRVPYDDTQDLKTQVAQSFESSLQHLGTDYLDSYLLHGPYNYPGLGEEDFEVWSTLEKIYETGKVKAIGISNVNSMQLEALVQTAKVKPMVVQNRCFASRGWDKSVRHLCESYGIKYQGFSLLTANPEVLSHPWVLQKAEDLKATPAQIVFAFSTQIGMLPLTGTKNTAHMSQDLAANQFQLSAEEIIKIENLVS